MATLLLSPCRNMAYFATSLDRSTPLTTRQRGDTVATVRRAVTSSVVATVVARAGYLITRVLIPPFVLAHLSLAEYGLWSIAFVLVAYLATSTVGLSSAYVRYVAHHAARAEFDRVNALLSTGCALTSALALAVLTGAWAGWPVLADWLRIPAALEPAARPVVLAVVTVFLLDVTVSIFRDAMTGAQRHAVVQALWAVSTTVEFLLILILVGAGRGLRGLAEAFIVRTVLHGALSLFAAYRALPWLRLSPRLLSREALGSILRFGGAMQALGLVTMMLWSLERTLAAVLIGLDAAGVMEIAKKLPSTVVSLPGAINAAVQPAASYLRGGLERDARAQAAVASLYLRSARYLSASAGLALAFLAVASLPILDVWLGRRYPGAALLMSAFGVAMHLHMLTGPGTSILAGIGRPAHQLAYIGPNVAALALTVPLAHLICGGWTAVGLGLATAVGTCLGAAVFLPRACALLHAPWPVFAREVLLPGALPWLVAGLATLPAWTLAPTESRLWGLAVLSGCAALYAIGSAGALSLVATAEERAATARLIGRVTGALAALRGARAA